MKYSLPFSAIVGAVTVVGLASAAAIDRTSFDVSPAVDALGQEAIKTLARRANGGSQDCFSVDAGFPRNMHWNSLDQFVTVDGMKCRPRLEMQDNSCHKHMDLGTRCASFCQISAFHFFSEPIDLMGGKMCRYGEGCELKQEQSFRVEISNTEVDHHLFDATASLSPSITWGLGFKEFNIPIPGIPGLSITKTSSRGRAGLRKRDAAAIAAASAGEVPETGYPFIDNILIEMRRQELEMETAEAERAALQSNPITKYKDTAMENEWNVTGPARDRKAKYRYPYLGATTDNRDKSKPVWKKIKPAAAPNDTAPVVPSGGVPAPAVPNGTAPIVPSGAAPVVPNGTAAPNGTAPAPAPAPAVPNGTAPAVPGKPHSVLHSGTWAVNAEAEAEDEDVAVFAKRSWIGDKFKGKGKKAKTSNNDFTTGPGPVMGPLPPLPAPVAPVPAPVAPPAAPAAGRKGFSFPLPLPEIKSPTVALAAAFSAHWTNDWTRTYFHSVERASFTSITHKQIPGEGCGAFWAVPVGVAYCGWLAVPRFPTHMQEAGLRWLAQTPADQLYDGTFKLGSWSPDGSHAQGDTYPAPMWNVTAGSCPANYHEIPYCHAGPLYQPGGPGGQQALHRTVWRPYDCATGEILPSHAQPREVREQLGFGEFFKYHAKSDPRLFNPQMAWNKQHADDAEFAEFDDFQN